MRVLARATLNGLAGRVVARAPPVARPWCKSCWNFPTLGNVFHLSEMTFLLIASIYLYKFIIPSIGISEPTPEMLKLSQNILIWSALLSHWNGQDLTAHDSWSWQLCCAFHECENDFHRTTPLFSSYLQSNICFLPILNLFSFFE